MSDAVIIWGMVCGTILLIVFGIVAIVSWVDRFHFTEMQRVRVLESQVKELREWRKTTGSAEKSTVSVMGRDILGLKKSKHEQRG